MLMIWAGILLISVVSGAPHDGGCPPEGVFGWEHETACDQYYKCENGTFSHEQCPNGLVFDDKSPVYDLCTYYWKVDCGKKTIEPAISSPGCPYEWGMFPSGHCTTYHNCAWGEVNVTECEEGLAYQEETHSCVWPDEVKGCDPEAIVGFKCPTQMNEMSYKFYPFPRFPHRDCNKLYVCVNDKPRLIKCGWGSAFSQHSYTCEAIQDVPECNAHY